MTDTAIVTALFLLVICAGFFLKAMQHLHSIKTFEFYDTNQDFEWPRGYQSVEVDVWSRDGRKTIRVQPNE